MFFWLINFLSSLLASIYWELRPVRYWFVGYWSKSSEFDGFVRKTLLLSASEGMSWFIKLLFGLKTMNGAYSDRLNSDLDTRKMGLLSWVGGSFIWRSNECLLLYWWNLFWVWNDHWSCLGSPASILIIIFLSFKHFLS